MTRVKRGYIAQRRRTKIHLFASTFIGAHSRLTRTAFPKKIIFRPNTPWIVRIRLFASTYYSMEPVIGTMKS